MLGRHLPTLNFGVEVQLLQMLLLTRMQASVIEVDVFFARFDMPINNYYTVLNSIDAIQLSSTLQI